jgi:hypothetical protein
VEVRLASVAADAIAGASIARRDVGFHPDDRLETCLLGFFLELPSPVKVTVVGDGEGRLLEFESSADEVVDSVGAVEEGVF